jgi:hypothetical protein
MVVLLTVRLAMSCDSPSEISQDLWMFQIGYWKSVGLVLGMLSALVWCVVGCTAWFFVALAVYKKRPWVRQGDGQLFFLFVSCFAGAVLANVVY